MKNVTLERFSCKMKKAIYIINCKICNAKYIGQASTNVNLRLNNHLTAIRKNREFQVSQHFVTHGIENLEIGLIEHRPLANQKELNIMEGYWISRFNTITDGLNTKDETNLYIDPHLLKATTHYQHDVECFPYQTSFIAESAQDNLK